MKKITKKIKKGTIRFFKGFVFKMINKILELATLITIGYALGLKLIKY